MTVQNTVYILWINIYKLPKLWSPFGNTLQPSMHLLGLRFSERRLSELHSKSFNPTYVIAMEADDFRLMSVSLLNNISFHFVWHKLPKCWEYKKQRCAIRQLLLVFRDYRTSADSSHIRELYAEENALPSNEIHFSLLAYGKNCNIFHTSRINRVVCVCCLVTQIQVKRFYLMLNRLGQNGRCWRNMVSGHGQRKCWHSSPGRSKYWS
jgi:hypothetical protein